MGRNLGVRRPLRAVLTGILLVSVTLVVPAAPGAAEPGYPSAVEVERARSRVADTAGRVGRIEAQLASANARSAALATQVARAAEAYNGARFRLLEAQRAARDARVQADQALRAVDAAKHELGRFAAAAYRSGGDFAGLAVFLDAEGPRDLISRASAIQSIGRHRDDALAGVEAAQVVAGVLEQRARDQVASSEAAAAEVQRAKEAAEAAFAAHQQAVADIESQREELVRALASARHTSVRLERARQAGIEAERAAAAKREAERRRQAQEQAEHDNGGGSGGGGGGGGSGGGGGGGGSGGGGTTDPGSGNSSGTRSGAERAIAFAQNQIGKPYEWAASGPDTFDCSGLTMRAWERGGVLLPHYSVAQYEQGRRVGLSQLRRGDLVFFASDQSDYHSIYHVGLYIGGGQMIEAPYTGETVRVSSIYRDSLFGAARP